MKYISRENLIEFLHILEKGYQVFIPVKKDNQRFFKKFDGSQQDMVIGQVRSFEPVKAFFSRAREKVAENFKPDIPHAENKPFAVIGVKACDLKGFKVQDHVFKNHDYVDPFYIKARTENLIISSDCTCTIDTCFCLALGVKPYATENFDINLSEIDGGFVVEAGSDRGKEIIGSNPAVFEEVKKKFIVEKDELRQIIVEEVKLNIQKNNIPNEKDYKGIIEKNFKSDIWQDEAKACVECGACNAICPTCHCFLLYDQKNEQQMLRLRLWDSCMIKDFARVAGGANPRSKLWMRLRNRFEKKFDYFSKVADIYACTGCGRCVSACPAKIDIRKVLKRLVKDAK